MCYTVAMPTKHLKNLLERVETWPEEDQEELAQLARDIEARRSGVYHATAEELEAMISALAQSGLPAQRLELEITESVLLADNASTLEILHQLRILGVRIAMDDFGTGYSSLSYLQSFPFDKIKIDRSFVHNLASNKNSTAIIRAVTALGNSLGMTTTGEGVETQEELSNT